jgi:hypothetical protein
MSQSLLGAQTLLWIINQQILKKKKYFNILIENKIDVDKKFEYSVRRLIGSLWADMKVITITE